MLSFDFSDKQIRVVKGELVGGKIKIAGAMVIDLPSGVIINGFIQELSKLVSIVNEQLIHNKFTDKEAVISLSSSQIVFRELKVPKEKMYRALVVSNLVAIHQKTYIGSLSAYCGAVSAACGAGAAISWLNGGDYNAISKTITNALANTSGIVCDGAKSSCAAKIASAVDAAIMAYALEDADHCFQAGEGLVRDNVEDTIRNMGYVGRVGMKDTDVTILNLMINQKKV